MKSSFQTILIIVFVVGFVLAIAIFSGLFSSSSGGTASTVAAGNVVVWGVAPNEPMQKYAQLFNDENLGYTISYQEHAPANLYPDFITALANGTPPDIILGSSETLPQFKDKITTIPFTTYTERQFRDTNVDGAQQFLTPTGITALPLVVDPLVVYYNKDMLVAKNFVVPPKTWSALQASVPLFTKRDAQNHLTQSALALGQANNIAHYRDILSTLFLQTGNAIVAYDATTGTYQPVLANGTANTSTTVNTSNAGTQLPAVQALLFYTSFSDPTTTSYTWNSSLPESLQSFLAGNSVFYIGRASELFSIQAQNPHLNFDVTQLFQSDAATRPVTYGSFIAAATVRGSLNPVAAYAASSAMASSANVDMLSKLLSLPPTRRDLLQVSQTNPYLAVFFNAALSVFSWPDPNISSTNKIFRDMITNVNSNTTDAQTAIYNANRDLQSSLQ